MLFSFLIITYNQERYIADAFKSALAQNYDELEIIVSDDNSSDRTFEIVQEIAAQYHGPIKIILNKNERNLGIGCNFYKAYTLAHGEWMFMAAGDDISYPDRCPCVRAIIDRNPDCLAVGAIRDVIDGGNRHLGYSLWHEVIHGASAAWHRSLFDRFPPIEKGNMSEDMVLFFRIFLLGGEAVNLFRPVVQYRIDGSSVSNRGVDNIVDFKKDLLKKKLSYEKIIHNNLSDLQHIGEKLDQMDYDRFRAILRDEAIRTGSETKQLQFFIETVKLPFLQCLRRLWGKSGISLKQKIFIALISNSLTRFLYHKAVFAPFMRRRLQLSRTHEEKPAQVISKHDLFARGRIL